MIENKEYSLMYIKMTKNIHPGKKEEELESQILY